MDWQTLYRISNMLTLPFWLLIIFLPTWRWTKRIASSLWIVAPSALFYVLTIVPQLPGFLGAMSGGGGFSNPTVYDLAAAFAAPEATVVVWAHMLTLDLFAGRWIYLDSLERGRNRILTGVVLFFTLMAGPFGVLLYLLDRTIFITEPDRNSESSDT